MTSIMNAQKQLERTLHEYREEYNWYPDAIVLSKDYYDVLKEELKEIGLPAEQGIRTYWGVNIEVVDKIDEENTIALILKGKNVSLSSSWRILSLEQVMDDAVKDARRYMQALQDIPTERSIQSQVAAMFGNPLTQKNKSRLDYFPTEAQRQKLLEAFGEWDSQGIKFNKIEYEPRRAYWVIYFERDTKTIECKVTVEMAENRTVGELQNSLLQSIALSLLSAF